MKHSTHLLPSQTWFVGHGPAHFVVHVCAAWSQVPPSPQSLSSLQRTQTAVSTRLSGVTQNGFSVGGLLVMEPSGPMM
ncbi:MAG TPA: hypothetical protein PKE31_10305 [Pseudomonadota bacterium]|nr:hypothetical protein [Pseudomonadota bacterium]